MSAATEQQLASELRAAITACRRGIIGIGLVSGLINLRGQIVTALDLRQRFGMPARAEGVLPMNVVVRTDDGSVSLLVDEIGDVLDVDDRTFERPPETLDAATRRLVRGAYKLDGQLLLVLETERAAALAA